MAQFGRGTIIININGGKTINYKLNKIKCERTDGKKEKEKRP